MAIQNRSWKALYRVYGTSERRSIMTLSLQGLAFAICAVASLFFFRDLTIYLTWSFVFLPVQVWSLLTGFFAGLMALMSVCFLVTAANLWYSSLILPWHVGQQMLEMVDWSYVCEALDIGCGSGMLLNAVAMRLKKEHTGDSAIGVDLWLDGDGKCMSSTLQTAALEQVHQYVMCKTGDPRSLPFEDDQFDLVVSALCLHKLGSDCGPRSTEACYERLKGLEELVRVLKPGGQAVVWDLCHVLEYASKLEDLNMCNVKVSNCIPAYMMQSHIVSFKKPSQRISF
ncbi:hypothetical protein L7F22_032098 [Adiantum nelumboides]|nr:hypothetical protein [Adiantum nelumboides]